MDTYPPDPIAGPADAIGIHRSRIPWTVLIFGFIGGISG